jgi:Uma2 family endonuclease
MSTATLVALEEYLSSTWGPDREFVDGRIVERNLGELDHSYLQGLFFDLFRQKGLFAFVELRVQVAPTRFRVPDVLAMREMPRSRFLRQSPYIVVEILSPEDRVSDMSERIEDYVASGINNVWVVDPQRKRLTVHDRAGARSCEGLVTTSDGAISIPLAEMFDSLPEVD